MPYASTVTYMSGSLCVDTGNNGDFWLANVDIPHGSTIVGMYFNYYNDVADPENSFIMLSRFQYDGTYDDILSISGSGTVIGHQSTYTNEVSNAVVDNLNYAYVLFWTGMTQQRLCGVNLVYAPPPIFFNALPLINR